MLKWLGVLVGWLSGKKPETLDERIVRLSKLAQIEEQRTEVLRKILEKQRKAGELAAKVLEERRVQHSLYSDMGVDSPQARKQKSVRLIVILSIALVFFVVILRGCFH